MSEILNTFGVDWKLLVIQAVNFGLLLLALTYFLYKPTIKILEERRAKIEKGVADAAHAKAQLEAAQEERGEIIRAASDEAEALAETVRKNARAAQEEILSEAEQQKTRILKEAEQAAAAEKERMLAESKKDIAQMAVLAAEKLLHSRSRT